MREIILAGMTITPPVPELSLAPIAFFVSDGSAVSAEAFGEALISQIGPELFKRQRAVFCKTPDQARAVGALAAAARAQGHPVCVFSTLAMPDTRSALKETFPEALDLFDEILSKASASLGLPAKPRVGASHGAYDAAARAAREQAVDYALSRDDGARADYSGADIILVGVSRSGKTPCCMWLALHYGLRAANYPLTEEDLSCGQWPRSLTGLEHLCAGLTLTPERLVEIRQARLRDSQYASLSTCASELVQVERMLAARGVPFFETTGRGVEEICAALIQGKGISPRLSF